MKKIQIEDQYLTVGLEAIKEAEKIVLNYFQKNLDISLKKDKSLVTIADKEVEAKIKQVISAHFPDHGFLGEEEGKENSNSQFTWVIDPIDGTKNFVRGLPFFSTLLTLVKDGQIIMGISNMPEFNELVYAVKGKGAFLNQQKLHVSKTTNLNESYLSLGTFAKFSEKGFEKGAIKLASKVRHQRAWGDCWHFHLLAQGKIDTVIEAHGEFWDFAPMKVFIEEAGGKVTNIEGKPFSMNSKSMIASNGLIHDQVVTILNQ